MAGRGRGRGKVLKAKQEKNTKLTACKNGLGHKHPKHIGKIHHTTKNWTNENTIIFPDLPFELDKSDSDSLSLLSDNAQYAPPTHSKKRKKENIQANQYISHDIDSRGICIKCGIEGPQNQLCSGEGGGTSTQWLQRNDCHHSSSSKKDLVLQTSAPPPPPEPAPANCSRAPSSPVMYSNHMTEEDICLDGAFSGSDAQTKFQDDTVRDPAVSNVCKATVNLDPVYIPSRHKTSPDLELWYLKADGVYKIPAAKSEFVKTTAWLDFMGAFPHVCRIDPVNQNNHWLGQPIDANLAVRCGTVDPSFTGYIDVCVFNKGQRDLIIKAGSPIAVLKKENYI